MPCPARKSREFWSGGRETNCGTDRNAAGQAKVAKDKSPDLIRRRYGDFDGDLYDSYRLAIACNRYEA
jgi:hypothetical protein